MTVMPPDVRADEDLVILENLDFDIVCRGQRGGGCDKKATWIATLLCCMTDTPVCDSHREQTLKFMSVNPVVYCMKCSYEWYPRDKINLEWEKL